ncbi:MAG: UDP-2,4-diacetamido-2,4,6-trideoxy-beta-L-altropyranose hydrolase [Lachnospiraceae bacterium]|nr:UDP-2,4-diacetamido-2,4,6-trideoxy-beta-L-altropyranose hydrolase [Lachnospiraceae bacterium]
MVLVRADGNSSIGVGHVMRCLSIADAFKRKNVEVIFATADDSMKNIIEDRGFSCFVLNSDYKNLETDFSNIQYIELINESDTIIVDSYYVREDFFTYIHNNFINKKIIYMDDLCEKAYPADVLINYNIYANRDKYAGLYETMKYNTDFILGPRFTPLRREFSEVRRIDIKEKVSDVLIMTGGADIHHTALGLIKTLKEYRNKHSIDGLDDIRFHFVVGAMSKDYDSILNEISGINNIVIHRNVKDMIPLMTSCDIAVSAAGTSLYELCACGVPTITYVLANNQIDGEKAFADSGAMFSIGDIRTDQLYCNKILDTVIKLAGDYNLRRMLSEKESTITDGIGADRIAEILEG